MKTHFIEYDFKHSDIQKVFDFVLRWFVGMHIQALLNEENDLFFIHGLFY